MPKNLVSTFLLTLLLMIVLKSSFSVQPVKAQGTIYIRADGSVDPPTAPIQREDDVYTFTANIYDSVVIERDNIVLDGVGYTLQGTEVDCSRGLDLTERSNVTVRDVQVEKFCCGISLTNSCRNTLIGNVISNSSSFGVSLDLGSTNNTIAANTISGNEEGISGGSDNTIVRNIITLNIEGISFFEGETGNNITENQITNNLDSGFEGGANFTTISRNNLTANKGCGVYAVGSYFVISENSITANGLDAVSVRYSSAFSILRNNITSNDDCGISLTSSQCGLIYGNNVIDNGCGIYVFESSDSLIYHNNFVNNSYENVFNFPSPLNTWDSGYPSSGNYWADYEGVDAFGGPYQNETRYDGICDSPYWIDVNNQDRYPLVSPRGLIDGDVNVDGKVDVKDIYAVAKAYGSSWEGPDPLAHQWNPVCDINSDLSVDVKDYYIVCKNYGKTYP